MSVVFFGTPEFALPSLRRLIDAGPRPVLVVTTPPRPRGRGQRVIPTPVADLAQAHGVDVAWPDRLTDIRSRLEALQPTALAVVAYGKFLPSWLLELAPALNVHPSLLPAYRGAAPIPWAIWHGEHETGVSIIRLSERMDAGPILSQVAVPIADDDDCGSLSQRLSQIGAELLADALRGTLLGFPQDETKVSYAPRIEAAHLWLDLEHPAPRLVDQVRALSPQPGAQMLWHGRRMKVLRATASGGEAAIGAPMGVRGEALGVGSGQGILWLERIRMEGRGDTTGAAFWRGERERDGRFEGTPGRD